MADAVNNPTYEFEPVVGKFTDGKLRVERAPLRGCFSLPAMLAGVCSELQFIITADNGVFKYRIVGFDQEHQTFVGERVE